MRSEGRNLELPRQLKKVKNYTKIDAISGTDGSVQLVAVKEIPL